MTLRFPAPHLNEQPWLAAAAYMREEAALMAPPEQEWARQRVQSQARASSLWRSSRPVAGTVAETYLARRGVRLPVPPTIRFHPELEDYPDNRPGLVALATCAGDGAPIDVQRTLLRHDGAGLAAVEFPTSTLGWQHRNGVIRLGEPSTVLLLGTTLEGCLAAQQETDVPAWVMLAKYASPGFTPPNGLPPKVRHVILLDDAEEARSTCPKARALAYAGLQAAGWHLRQLGKHVHVLCPPCPLHAHAPASLPGLGCSGFRAPDFPRSGHGILCGRRRPLKARAEAN
jgi:DNA primase